MQIKINSHNFTLHHLGAIYWEEQKTLLVSDVHFGKVSHFRKNGMAIPNAVILENFINLNVLLEEFNPTKIIFLGDLFHSSLNNEWTLFEEWIKNCDQKVVLIEGNHDVIDKENYLNLDIEVFSQLIIDDFLLTHHPIETKEYFNFCGHIHPGVKIYGIGRQYLKLSCFFQKKNQMILPAFGAFTGNFFIKPTEDNTIFGIADSTVFKVNLS